MKKFLKDKEFKVLLVLVSVYSLICLAGYFQKADYHHKQTDHYYYLSLADSLRTTGQMRELIDYDNSVCPTFTTGAALVLLPGSYFSSAVAFQSASIFYFLLNLISLVFIYGLLKHWKLKPRIIFYICLLYFISFPVTMFKLWPINEGPSYFLTSMFLYYFFTARSKAAYFIPAFIAPIFRVHIFLFEVGLLIYGVLLKNKEILLRSLASMAISASGLVFYLILFPAKQMALGPQLTGKNSFISVPMKVFSSLLELFVPEGVIIKFQSMNISPYFAAGLGMILFLILVMLFLKNKKTKNSPLNLLPAVLFVVVTLALCASLVIIARFYAPAYFWICCGIVLFLSHHSQKIQQVVIGFLLALQVLFGLIYLVTPTTDTYASLKNELKVVAEKASLGPKLYYSKDFPIHPREIYGRFRRPSEAWSEIPSKNEKFIVLTLHPEAQITKLKSCKVDPISIGGVTALNANCE